MTRTRVRPGSEQTALRICECGDLHIGPCPIEYARYGVGSLDRHEARPRRARVAHACDCAFTSPTAADDHLLRRCGSTIEPGEIYVEMPRADRPYSDAARLPSWTLSLEHAVMYHSDVIRVGLNADAKIGTLESDKISA